MVLAGGVVAASAVAVAVYMSRSKTKKPIINYMVCRSINLKLKAQLISAQRLVNMALTGAEAGRWLAGAAVLRPRNCMC